MANVYIAVDLGIRSTEGYTTAKRLYEERRAAQKRLNEINRLLREIGELNPCAIAVAGAETQLRVPQGRTKKD